jgi:coproporphyrinogen III oxidase-like Fe-S oxidoreductase
LHSYQEKFRRSLQILKYLWSAIQKAWIIKRSREFIRKVGITRLSLGVQSLNSKTLQKVARPHNAETTLKSLQLLKDFGWENFGCDLIMGLPYQTLSEFKGHLENSF